MSQLPPHLQSDATGRFPEINSSRIVTSPIATEIVFTWRNREITLTNLLRWCVLAVTAGAASLALFVLHVVLVLT